jgi:HEAT repeat protein
MTTEEILEFIRELPDQTVIGISAVAVIILAIIVQTLVAHHRFMVKLRNSPEDEEAAEAVLERLKAHPTAGLAGRALHYIPDTALFSIFIAALDHRKIAAELLQWIDEHEDMFVYRRLALSGRGEEFDGRKARDLLSSHLDRIREMTGDPEWPARYMAVKVLIYDDDERSVRAIEEMWDDPHTLIRRSLIEEYSPSDPDAFYAQLVEIITYDPAYEVRRTAKERILAEYSDRYEVDYSSLAPEQILHHIEQFVTDSTEDVNTALGFLREDDLELRFAASRYLERAGALEILFNDVDIADREQLERNEQLLMNAAAVHCDSFLAAISDTDNPAALTIAADILAEYGDTALIPSLANRVFLRYADVPEERRLLEQTLVCVRKRGTEQAVRSLSEELYARRYDTEDAALFLDHVPESYPFVTVSKLLLLLRDPDFSLREKLHEAFLRIDPSYYLSELFEILKSERDEYAHSVRISALLLLGKLNLSYCMQFLLEQMPILPFEEARDFSVHLKEYEGKLFRTRVLDLLQKNDGKVKAALISAIPATGDKEFLKPIRNAVGDADPEVRRAAVWALTEYGDQRSMKSSLDLLRDPVERVRREAARALGSSGNESILESFSDILADENEVDTVKHAALEGLGVSEERKSVDILIEQLNDRADQHYEETLNALAQKQKQDLIKQIIGHMKDAEPDLRERISEGFKRMGVRAEAPLIELLREDIASLSPHLAYVLEETGCVEHTVRKLNHRDASVRRDAADILSRIGTTSAFRGIVLASRDPDEEVRVMVTRALERLNSESGNEILEQLKSDPDKRIRKYTLWAMERIRAKNNGDTESSGEK